jgi:hypothetical protein
LQTRLAGRFRKQQKFAAGYSPLYSRLFGLPADWLSAPRPSDPLVAWLLRAAAARSSFDVPLLLLAGLHREVLTGVAEAADLATYYPTVGGTRSPEEGELAGALRAAILARKDQLAAFLRTATVQTNETARGLCWLLPVLYTGWRAIHLVDLGASAGLNLVADQRCYRLTGGKEWVECAVRTIQAGAHGAPEKMGHFACKGKSVESASVLDLGSGEHVEFLVAGQGTLPLPPPQCRLPAILSRIGCDLAPFPLATDRDEQTLAAFVWGDQPGRLAMLRQGIAALKRIRGSRAPVQLHAAHLPDGLTEFLEQRITPCSDAPVVLYNTYLTTYLHDKGASLRPQLAAWAAGQTQPVLWLQWETLWQGPRPPDFGWVGWTADLWRDGRHLHWHLAWAHPHGTQIRWLPESAAWADFWREQE